MLVSGLLRLLCPYWRVLLLVPDVSSVWLAYVGPAAAPVLYGVYGSEDAAWAALLEDAVTRLDGLEHPPWIPHPALFDELESSHALAGDEGAVRTAWMTERTSDEILAEVFAFILVEERIVQH